MIAEDEPVALGRQDTFIGRHVLTTPHGVALQRAAIQGSPAARTAVLSRP